MCLILLALSSHERYPLIVAANRDEFYARPTAAADFWSGPRRLLAGRDLESGGTWLGLAAGGRFAAVTNYRNPAEPAPPAAISRGLLVSDYLYADSDPAAYLARVAQRAGRYRGFNLVCGDVFGLYYFSNRAGTPATPIGTGLHAISNHLLDTPWPKVVRSKQRLQRLLDADAVDAQSLFALLADEREAAPESLPRTGVAPELERRLSPIFIRAGDYGTRSSTVLLFDGADTVEFHERSFAPGHAASTRSHTFSLTQSARAIGTGA